MLVACGGATSSNPGEADKVLNLSQAGTDRNVQLEVTNVTGSIIKELSPISRDLLDLSAYVYVADTSVSRGGEADVWGAKWNRSFMIVLPVRDLATWKKPTVGGALKKALQYLTGDRFQFEFVQRGGDPDQTYLQFPSWKPFEGADCVSLFSGGADSLAAAVQGVRAGRRPLLVSHRSAAVLDSRQSNLRDQLRLHLPEWSFPHVSVWVHRTGARPADFSQRSRSFLFLSLASVIARELGLDSVVVGENGIVSMNLAKLEQSFGTRASRSTRPKSLQLFREFVSTLPGRPIAVENPLMMKTKAEVLSVISDAGVPQLIQESVSCAHTMGRPAIAPHCGECSQCVDRRFAAVAAGVEAYDLPERYGADVFLDDLKGEGLKQAESHVRAAYYFEATSAEMMVLDNPDLLEALPYLGSSSAKAATALYDLHQRFASQTLAALTEMTKRHSEELVRGDLPERCLLALAAARRFRKEVALDMGQRITRILLRDLPIRFQTEPPSSEQVLQDATEAALKSAEEALRREGPWVPYSVVHTVPDFSSELTNVPLFVELKLVKDAASRRYAVKSIGEASTYYPDQGTTALFIVYDTARHITDDEEFARPFVAKDPQRIAVRVIR
ncbi:7-cyano-7-deazaguanine synthase [Gemmatimonadota bacterium]